MGAFRVRQDFPFQSSTETPLQGLRPEEAHPTQLRCAPEEFDTILQHHLLLLSTGAAILESAPSWRGWHRLSLSSLAEFSSSHRAGQACPLTAGSLIPTRVKSV